MKKHKIKPIEGNKIVLKPFSKNFISNDYLAWMNNKEITKFIQKAKENTSLDDLYLFSNKMIDSEVDYFFAIVHKEKQCHIGNVRLGPINFNLMKSNFGILIGDKSFHGSGIATEVLELIKYFGFNYLKLEQIQFPVVKEHTAAMRLYAKTKFTCSGEIKKTFDKDGKSWKLVEWTMNNLDYKKNKND
jgi:ribosomal-protein-alanine N-acetyltransferase